MQDIGKAGYARITENFLGYIWCVLLASISSRLSLLHSIAQVLLSWHVPIISTKNILSISLAAMTGSWRTLSSSHPCFVSLHPPVSASLLKRLVGVFFYCSSRFDKLMAGFFKVEPSLSFPSELKLPRDPPGLNPSLVPSSTRNQKRARPLDTTIEWLRNKASQQLNYQMFVDSHHRALQNMKIVDVWRFAAYFYDIYFWAKCDATVQSSSSLPFLHI